MKTETKKLNFDYLQDVGVLQELEDYVEEARAKGYQGNSNAMLIRLIKEEINGDTVRTIDLPKPFRGQVNSDMGNGMTFKKATVYRINKLRDYIGKLIAKLKAKDARIAELEKQLADKA